MFDSNELELVEGTDTLQTKVWFDKSQLLFQKMSSPPL